MIYKDKITRRDFLSGTQIAIGAAIYPTMLSACSKTSSKLNNHTNFQLPETYYPPQKIGLRGSHDGSWETMHSRVSGRDFPHQQISEEYDLVIVGGGISGLSAAYFFQKEQPNSKILIMDNHDDFGGHAKRNEYNLDGRNIIVNGGTLNIEQPSNYSVVAMDYLNEIGINTELYKEKTGEMIREHRTHGLGGSTFFNKETFGGKDGFSKRDRRAVGAWDDFWDNAPIDKTLKKQFRKLHNEDVKAESFVGLSDQEKKVKLAGMTYADYVTNELGIDPRVLPLYAPGLHFRFYVGAEQVPALFCWELGGNPGFEHLNLLTLCFNYCY